MPTNPWEEFDKEVAAEAKRISRIANPAQRARAYAAMNKWVQEGAENLQALIGMREGLDTSNAELEVSYMGNRYV